MVPVFDTLSIMLKFLITLTLVTMLLSPLPVIPIAWAVFTPVVRLSWQLPTLAMIMRCVLTRCMTVVVTTLTGLVFATSMLLLAILKDSVARMVPFSGLKTVVSLLGTLLGSPNMPNVGRSRHLVKDFRWPMFIFRAPWYRRCPFV